MPSDCQSRQSDFDMRGGGRTEALKVTTERLPDCKVKMTVEIEPARVDEPLRRVARRVSQQFNVPGFRPGKAPFNVVVRRFGRDALLDEVVNKEGQAWYEEALEEAELEPYDQAQLEITSYDPLTMAFTMPVAPVVDLGEYRDIRLDWEPPTVSDEEVEKELARLQKKSATLEPRDRPAEMEDVTTLDIEGRIGDEVVVNAEERAVTLNPDISYPVAGFAAKIVGMSPGEEREFALTYPEDHPNAAWRGKEAHFQVHMHGLKVWVTPELDDELAKTMGGYETLDEWRANVRQELETQALREAESTYANAVLDALIAQAHIEFPNIVLENELDRLVEERDQALKERGLGLENYLIMTGTSREAYRESLQENAVRRVRRGLTLAKLIETEEFQVSDADMVAEFERLKEALGEGAESFEEAFSLEALRTPLHDNLLTRAAMDALKAIARGEYVPQAAPDSAEEEAESTETAAEVTTEVAAAVTDEVSTDQDSESDE